MKKQFLLELAQLVHESLEAQRDDLMYGPVHDSHNKAAEAIPSTTTVEAMDSTQSEGGPHSCG